MLNKYDPKNIRLMFTDTDRLLYEIKKMLTRICMRKIENILTLLIIQLIVNIILKKKTRNKMVLGKMNTYKRVFWTRK